MKGKRKKRSIIKKWILAYHSKIDHLQGLKRICYYCSVLFFPYLFLTILYMLIRWKEFCRVNLIFWIVLIIAITWFPLGPVLVHRFYRAFVSMSEDIKLPKAVLNYFEKNKERHFTLFVRYRVVEGLIFFCVSIIPILRYPYILSKNISFGSKDWFFWLIVLFLVWFVFYVVNATAYISLFGFHIIRDLQRGKIFKYDPREKCDRYAIEKINELAVKAVRYTISAAIFLPLAIYYCLRQPELSFGDGRVVLYFEDNSQGSIYIFWVVLIMLFYAGFLCFSLSLARKVHRYDRKTKIVTLENERYKFVNIKVNPKVDVLSLENSLYIIGKYVQLQEFRLLCRKKHSIDGNLLAATITTIATLLSAIPGILNVFF